MKGISVLAWGVLLLLSPLGQSAQIRQAANAQTAVLNKLCPGDPACRELDSWTKKPECGDFYAYADILIRYVTPQTNPKKCTNLNFVKQNLKGILPNTFDGLTSVKILKLTTNLLPSLDATILRGLSGLEELYSDKNAITRISDNTFSGMPLRALNIGFNQLTALTPGMFAGIKPSLTYLSLSKNKITKVGTELSKLASHLRQLNLDANGITAIDDKAFSGMTGLTTLFLPRNKLTAVSANVFKGLTSIGLLYVQRDLQDNKIAKIADGAFASQGKIPYLSLAGNSLTALSNNAFKGLKSLTQLDIYDNPKLAESASNNAFASAGLPKLNYILVWDTGMKCPWVLSPTGGNAPKGTYCQDTN